MKQKLFLVLILSALILSPVKAQGHEGGFKIVGYYSLRAAMGDFKNFPFKRITHVNLYFMNPDTLGNFVKDYSMLEPFIARAHRKNVKVLFSIAGGGAHPYYHYLLKDGQRGMFIQNLVNLAVKYNFDGIDVDIEGSDIDENYEKFVGELSTVLKEKQKLMTAAIAVYYKDQFTDEALSKFDFVNVMVYDRTGPWRPEKQGQHSSYEDAVEDLDYFAKEREIPSSKMVLGVPFYGYGFGPETRAPVKSMSYREITSKFPGSESFDQLTFDDGMIMYYNGMPTIMKKTELAKSKASGVMIWQLQGDAEGLKSLLRVIHKTGNSKK